MPPPTPPPPPVNIQMPPGFGFYVVGYFPSYRIVSEYPDRMYKMCNVINYAFASVNASGTLDFNTQTKFDSVYNRAKANGVKVFLSINGAHADFAKACASPSSRLIFINDVMKKLRLLKLDGIDMDWEYPTAADGTHETFAVMMKQLSDSLHVDAKYYL
ncbi:MAG TPA: glycoside hydrolase family 18 protein, partial [Niabella sp.]|nr:glycoside hydrolase family 18 protein [Niabella sp.]